MNNETQKINSVKYITNSYCYIRTNFNKNPDKRDEDNVFKFFLGLMTAKLKPKNISEEKIKLMSENAWNKMKKEEKEKIIKKYEQKKKELKNNILKLEVLKYIKRNSISNNNLNKMDNDIINMKIKTRLSHQFQFVKFEDELDLLEKRIKTILPKIEYLKSTEKDEIEFDKYIDKQNEISSELKKLLAEKITRENGTKIEEKKFALMKEYEPLYKKMSEYFKKHDASMRLYNDINKEGAQILEEVKRQIDVYNTQKLNLKKEVNKIIEQFMNLMEEIKNLKLVEINEKCNREVKNAMNFFEDLKKMQNKLSSFVDELKDNIKKQQNEIIPQDKADLINKKQNELSELLDKLKNTKKDYDFLMQLIEEEKDIIKNCEKLNNDIDNSKVTFNKVKNQLDNYEKQMKKIAENINNFQNELQKIVELFNKFITEHNDIKNQIAELFEKFKEKNIPISENLEKFIKKVTELNEGFKELKVKEMIEKKNELFSNFKKADEILDILYNKIKMSNSKKKMQSNSNLNDPKIKEIKEKVYKNIVNLENEQNNIKITLEKIKNDKNKLKENINQLNTKEENELENIKKVSNNDINNITIQIIKSNFEKFNKFNEKIQEFGPKINDISQRCKVLFEEYNSFIKIESENRKNIYENIKNLENNGIELDENIKNILTKSSEIFDGIDTLNLNELNRLFSNKLLAKFKEMQNIIKTVSEKAKQK